MKFKIYLVLCAKVEHYGCSLHSSPQLDLFRQLPWCSFKQDHLLFCTTPWALCSWRWTVLSCFCPGGSSLSPLGCELLGWTAHHLPLYLCQGLICSGSHMSRLCTPLLPLSHPPWPRSWVWLYETYSRADRPLQIQTHSPAVGPDHRQWLILPCFLHYPILASHTSSTSFLFALS